MIDRFREAANDPSLVILEGFHAVKHAHRCGAEILSIVHSRDKPLTSLIDDTAPEMGPIVARATAVDAGSFGALFRHPHPTGLAAVARRPAAIDIDSIPETAPIVLLDHPRHLGNIGATIRISAAGGAAGFVSVGDVDPWHPAALRGSAGLHFALPILPMPALTTSSRPLIAFDPEGEDATGYTPPTNAILAFGSERTGLSEETKRAADRLIAFPMRPGVSSINLAASVGIGLYMWRLSAPPTPQAPLT